MDPIFHLLIISFSLGVAFGLMAGYLFRNQKFRILNSSLLIFIVSLFHLSYIFIICAGQYFFLIPSLVWIIGIEVVIGFRRFKDLIFVSWGLFSLLFFSYVGSMTLWQIFVESRIDGDVGTGYGFGKIFIHIGGAILPLFSLGFAIAATIVIKNSKPIKPR
jgi:hypothetical protein